MIGRIIAVSLVSVWIAALAGAAAAPDKIRENPDVFALDGAYNIVDEEHFGIADGRMTMGIPYKTVLSVSGLWAPPFVSSDFHPGITLDGLPVPTVRYTWHPYSVERTGALPGITVKSVTALIPGTRAGVMAVTIRNEKAERRTVPLEFHLRGSLDRSEWWEFARTLSKTTATRTVADGFLTLAQGAQSVVFHAGGDIRWEEGREYDRGALVLPASGETRIFLTFAIGPAAEARAECETIADDPGKAIDGAETVYAGQVRDLYRKLPRLESSNPALVHFYNRSLVPLLLNRWDVPEFLLHPYYSTGSINGGCICSYLWDIGESWEILPLVDPEATKAHIRQFVATDMLSHFAFDPVKGTAWGPWYPVNQEKIVGLIYYYVKNTGDTAFLKDTVAGKTILEHVLDNARFGDDPSKPVSLIDYGPSNSHLELRRGYPYNGVMPDLNGRRYASYLLAAELAEVAGKPAPLLVQRAEDLQAVLKRDLWNEKTRWFDFIDADGNRDSRYTIQIFKLFGSKVLDPEEEAGLLAHVKNEEEFLSEYGMHSLAKTDIAYDQVDIDNGGGGSFNSFPPQIAEKLYRAGHPAEAENILKRLLWWGDRAPYWGDSLVANLPDYRRDTPYQCSLSAPAAAQCIIFGMFGVSAGFDGVIRIDPRPPAFAPRIALKGLHLRGHVLDIAVNGSRYEVREGDRTLSAKIGTPILVRGEEARSAK